MLTSALHGFLLALGLILPLGAQNAFIFNLGARNAQFRRTLPAVVTAALCDTCLLALAVLGVSVLIFGIPVLKGFLLAGGILFLLYMGWTTWRSSAEEGKTRQTGAYPVRKQIAYTMSVSLLNPHAIMDTVGVIGTSSLNYAGAEKWMFACACILVSWLWFVALAWAGRMVGSLDRTGKLLRVLNRVSAVVIWFSAAMMLYLWL
ncbi:amino acid transporter [Cohnella nanjingensis]|uniref:Amino acid transporter n=2 Tax=Cohnella nanjingensis TaxID=1387779 RepID=A0A7X0RW52_9BACL|nr:amino acid transporter [Cohnella nanjingensis]